MKITPLNVYSQLLLTVTARFVYASQMLRPRGVSLSKASLYDPNREFTCFDGSGKIPFKYVNDDYCDCQDGSDEPGTAACPNGTFFCNNVGHSPILVPSSRVNDGICDCCDASDEYGSSSDCLDTCLELGRAAREDAKRVQEEQQRGFVLKQQMIADSLVIKKEKQVKVEELRKEQEVAQTNRDLKEQVKKSAEEPENLALESYRAVEAEMKAQEEEERKVNEETEAQEAFEHLDSNQDGSLTVDELQSRQTFDTNRDGEVSVDEAKFYLQQEESMDWEKFLKTGWQLMRPVYLMDKRIFTPPTPEPTPELEPPVDEDLQETDEEEDLDEHGEEEEDEEEELDEDIPKEEEEEEAEEVEQPKYDEETQALVNVANAARQEYDEADRKLKDLQKDVQTLENSLNKDYGPNDEFRVLEGSCFDFNDREYTYTLCPFEKAVQKSKNGYGEVRLGQWGEWVGVEDKYAIMKYTNGQTCWNGPARTAEVRLTCGTENILTGVSEPNRCEYLYQFITPAVCVQSIDETHTHTEL